MNDVEVMEQIGDSVHSEEGWITYDIRDKIDNLLKLWKKVVPALDKMFHVE